MITIKSFINYLETRIIEHESKRCKCKNENDAITIYDVRLRDPLKDIIEYLSIGERFPLLFVSTYFNEIVIDVNNYDKQKNKKQFITKSTTLQLIDWYKFLYPKSYRNVIKFESIISYGNSELLDLYYNSRKILSIFNLSVHHFLLAVSNGNLDNMKWFKRKGCPLNKEIFYAAVLYGNLDNMKWLLQNGCPCDELIFKFAVTNGNLNNMEWSYKHFKYLYNKHNHQSYSYGRQIFRAAARNGNLKIMKWLFENEFPWDEWTFYETVKNGNLKNMKWLKENGCPWDECSLWMAVCKENVKNINWLLKNGCPCDGMTYTIIISRYLNEKSYKTNENIK